MLKQELLTDLCYKQTRDNGHILQAETISALHMAPLEQTIHYQLTITHRKMVLYRVAEKVSCEGCIEQDRLYRSIQTTGRMVL